MKKILTLRNVLILSAVLFGLLVFIFSFVAAFRLTPENGQWSENLGIIWGSRTVKNYDGSSHTVAPEDAYKGLALPIIGAILVFLAAICACLVVFLGDKISFLKDEKVRKIVLFVCGGLFVLGGIFTFFTQAQLEAQMAKDNGITVNDLHDLWKNLGYKPSCGLPIVSGILAILGGGAIVASQFIADKQLAK